MRGELDVAEAISTLLEYAGSKATLSDDERKQVAGATHATYRVVSTGDQLLRSLDVHARLALRAPGRLSLAVGRLVGARVDLRVAIATPRK